MKKIIIIGVLLILVGLDYVFVVGPCLNQVNQNANKPISFDVVFKTGANMDEVKQFADDLKQYYQGSVITKIASEANARITIQVPPNNLKTFADFNTFVNNETKKYSNLTLERSSGVGGIDAEASIVFGSNSQTYIVRAYCFNPILSLSTIMHLFTKKEDANKLSDARARAYIAMARVQAMVYNETYGSYTDLCTSSSTKSLKSVIDNMGKNNMENISCFATSTYWAISGSLKDTPNIGYCTDNNGFNTTVSVPTIATTGKCN